MIKHHNCYFSEFDSWVKKMTDKTYPRKGAKTVTEFKIINHSTFKALNNGQMCMSIVYEENHIPVESPEKKEELGMGRVHTPTLKVLEQKKSHISFVKKQTPEEALLAIVSLKDWRNYMKLLDFPKAEDNISRIEKGQEENGTMHNSLPYKLGDKVIPLCYSYTHTLQNDATNEIGLITSVKLEKEGTSRETRARYLVGEKWYWATELIPA